MWSRLVLRIAGVFERGQNVIQVTGTIMAHLRWYVAMSGAHKEVVRPYISHRRVQPPLDIPTLVQYSRHLCRH